MSADYESFLASKAQLATFEGLPEVPALNPMLFPFQRDAVAWALRRGRAALFEECGLGKTFQQIEWARCVAEHTGGGVLILAPLAVAQQTIREAARLGIEVRYAENQSDTAPGPSPAPKGICITNYERLDRFHGASFAGVVLDESSILKSFMGKTKRALVEGFARTPFRLACTATPAPNDHIELGNHSEFLGVLPSFEMLTRFFINDTSLFGNYRLKGHAEVPFWDWVCTWARCVTKPSDLGYADDGYVLPPLEIVKEVVEVDVVDGRGDALFRSPDLSATGLHAEKRRTAGTRAARVANLIAREEDESWIVWCETDYEADALLAFIPDAIEVRGGQSLESKERKLLAFADGSAKVLISKPSLTGFGLNWQHCARVAFVGATFSYEAFHQAIRRTWRFGQRRPVRAHVVMAATEMTVWDTMMRKAAGHTGMSEAMSAAMRRARGLEAVRVAYRATHEASLPSWMRKP